MPPLFGSWAHGPQPSSVRPPQLGWGAWPPQDVASFGNPPSRSTVWHLAVVLGWFVGCGILTVLGYR